MENLTLGHLERGSSHRLKGAARPKLDIVWLYRSPIPVERRWAFYLFKRFLRILPAFTVPTGGGGGYPDGA